MTSWWIAILLSCSCALGVAWAQEVRIRYAVERTHAASMARATEQQIIADIALRLAAQRPVERGLATSEAVTRYLAGIERHPSVRDDGVTWRKKP